MTELEPGGLRPFLSKIAAGKTLSQSEMTDAIGVLFDGAASEIEIAGFLMGLRARSETAQEIAAAARAMRARAIPVDAPQGVVDTCGTGGDGADTFNVSTAAALIAAGAGAKVAKHGNRAASSRSGSSDVLAQLGVNLNAAPDVISKCIQDAGVGFMFAAYHHNAVAQVAPIRKALGVRTIFNLLGPLSNPAGAKRQLIGVFDPAYLTPLAEALRTNECEKAWIAHGCDGLDELTVTGPSSVAALEGGAITTFEVHPEDAGLAVHDAEELKGGTPADNAAALTALLDGATGAYRDIAVFNAAATLIISENASHLDEAARMAEASIDSGAAKKALLALVSISTAQQQT